MGCMARRIVTYRLAGHAPGRWRRELRVGDRCGALLTATAAVSPKMASGLLEDFAERVDEAQRP